MTLLYIFISIIVIIFFVYLGLAIDLTNKTIKKKNNTTEGLAAVIIESFEKKWSSKINDWFKNIKKEKKVFKSPYGYDIHAYEIKNDPKKYAIILHGVTTTKEFMSKFAYMYNQLGYSVIAWDSRSHGKSGGDNISYGYFEKYDLKVIVDYVREQVGEDGIIGLHGESMGSGILLSYATKVADNCDFYIADCAYSNFYEEIKYQFNKVINLPNLISDSVMEFTNIFSKLIYKIDLKDINILESIKNIKSPILFINTVGDTYIPTHMSDDLFKNCISDKKEIHIFEKGGHAFAFNSQPEEYCELCKTFLIKNVET